MNDHTTFGLNVQMSLAEYREIDAIHRRVRPWDDRERRIVKSWLRNLAAAARRQVVARAIADRASQETRH